jgi:hypothetical protein
MRSFLFLILMVISIRMVAQHPSVSVSRHSWDWNDNGCIYRWSVTCSNFSGKIYTGVKFKLTIRSRIDHEVIYSKVHTVTLNLGPHETIPSPKFRLAGELCGIDDLDSMEDHFLETEVIAAW